MKTLTPQLQKIAIKKIASYPSSTREPDLDFRKLVDKQEQAEITMKLEETENRKLQYVNNFQTTTTQINSIHNSDIDLSEEILNIYEKNTNSKNGVSIAEKTDIALLNADKNNKTTRKNHQYTRSQTIFFINKFKKIKFYQKKFHSINSFGKPLRNSSKK